jgi:hypothetical protein
MKGFMLLTVTALAATPAAAQSSLTTAMSCALARSLVASRGAVVLHTGPATYDRFVRDSSYCPWPMTARTTYVPASDTPQCPVGAVCRDTTNENGQ